MAIKKRTTKKTSSKTATKKKSAKKTVKKAAVALPAAAKKSTKKVVTKKNKKKAAPVSLIAEPRISVIKFLFRSGIASSQWSFYRSIAASSGVVRATVNNWKKVLQLS